jgi:hypothetical protein
VSILTGRELEFLGSLSASWSRLYWNELARLLKEDHNPRDARHEARSPQSRRSKASIPSQAVKSWRLAKNR